MMGMQQRPSLTSEQTETVNSILSNYDAENISEDDAKEIFEQFKEAGIGGPGLKEAIEAAGFDAEELRELGMPEEDKGNMPPPPPSFGQGMGTSGSATGINTTTLQTLESILSDYDLSNLSSDKQNELVSRLQSSGLLNSGSLINISA
ncbi:MAG: hypothetical protein LWX83_12430 [Anaerolineae bacterium]|nr:hypothetical protein [Anaerolineae bacterium]